MRSYFKYFLGFVMVIVFFFTIRRWLDGKREAIQDIDIVRNTDTKNAHLGTWAQQNGHTLTKFRLKRDSSFTYEAVTGPSSDTTRYKGQYHIQPAVVDYEGLHYPRLIALSNDGDTIINHFIQMARATKQDVDMMKLLTDNGPDAPAMLFYRIMQ